jgi:hypothetical protein
MVFPQEKMDGSLASLESSSSGLVFDQLLWCMWQQCHLLKFKYSLEINMPLVIAYENPWVGVFTILAVLPYFAITYQFCHIGSWLIFKSRLSNQKVL